MTNQTDNLEEKKAKGGKPVYKILFVVFLVIFLGATGLMLFENYKNKQDENKFDELSNMTIDTQTENETETESETEERVDELLQRGIQVPERNMDWEALKAENEHIYAWIYIPDTNVDYPVLQHPDEASYYLKRGLDHKSSTAGCIYTQYYNSTDFTDLNTVIYGHNMKNKSMFATIHKFESLDFFESHPYIYIYMPDKVLVYEVFAAYERDDRHLLLSYNYSNDVSYQGYLDSIYEIRDIGAHFREDIELTTEDRLLSLTTCVANEAGNRYLVQGVLVNPSALDVAEE